MNAQKKHSCVSSVFYMVSVSRLHLWLCSACFVFHQYSVHRNTRNDFHEISTIRVRTVSRLDHREFALSTKSQKLESTIFGRENSLENTMRSRAICIVFRVFAFAVRREDAKSVAINIAFQREWLECENTMFVTRKRDIFLILLKLALQISCFCDFAFAVGRSWFQKREDAILSRSKYHVLAFSPSRSNAKMWYW